MIWNEWKRSFSALKIFKIGLIGRGTLKYSIFLRIMCGKPLLIYFSQVGLKSSVWITVSFLFSCIPGFFYSPRSYMINLLKINCGLLPVECRDCVFDGK